MITVELICSHRIEFDYHSKSKNAVPDESEIEHVQNCLIDNYRSGSLNMVKLINGKEYEFNGWWKIL